MCKFFSCIATRDGRLLFTEQDRHEEIVRRASLRDGHIAYFVRLECLPPFVDVYVDEQEIPTWFDLNEWSDRVIILASRVNRVFQQYEAVEQSAREHYQTARQSAREEYRAVERPAWEQYLGIEQPALKQYQAATRPAWEQYQAATLPAWEQYQAATLPAWEQVLETLAKIEGYCIS